MSSSSATKNTDDSGAPATPSTSSSSTTKKTPPSPSTDLANADGTLKLDPRGTNVTVHDQQYFVTRNALFCFGVNNPIRRAFLWLVTWNWFDRFIMSIILTNAIFMGLADYSVVEKSGSPFSTDFRTGKTSIINQIIEGVDPTFTGIYCIEACIKIVAYGFISGPNTYLRNGWNVLDFTAAVSSVAALIPNVPNVSSLRTLRVLRPLRSLKMLPGMKVIINAMIMAIEPLANVVILLFAVFVIFGILMTQLFMGVQHQRCRITPFPVVLQNTTDANYPPTPLYMAQVLANPEAYQCLPGVANDDANNWNQKTSKWSTPQNCMWPVDTSDQRICSTAEQFGNHRCASENNQYCGSNYDSFGNPRFTNPAVMLLDGNYIPELNYGYTTFDHLPVAFLTIFQCVTEEGWVDVMYQIQDGFNGLAGAIVFILLLIFGSFLLLNLTLAVLEDALSAQKDIEEELQEEEHQKELELSQDLDGSENKEDKDQGDASETTPPNQGWRIPIYNLVTNPLFDLFIIILIILNTIVLAADHYPMDITAEFTLEIINFILTVLFSIEMIVKLLGLGVKQYVKDGFNTFDAVVVVASWAELAFAPPRFITGSNESGESALSALRTFRLFRVFKLARSWSDLRIILETIVKTLQDVSNFAVLLLLFMYIFSLVGMQFFANRFRFDNDGIVVPLDDPLHALSEQPRAHFDTLGWALITIFQLLSGENWNTVMYDGIRAGGGGAALYFIVMVILGDFIILNLFLAILLTNFDGLDEAQKEETEHNEQYEADNEGVAQGKCCGLCGNGTTGNRTKVAPTPVKASENDEAWNFARRDEVDFAKNYKGDGFAGQGANKTNDLDDDFGTVAGDDDDEDLQALGVAPNLTNAKGQSATLEQMKMAQNFTQRLQKNRRGSLASPSVSRSMTMHTNDLIADIYIEKQDGARTTLNISQEPDRGGIIMTIGQLQNEIFKKTHVSPEDQELKWKKNVWDTSKRIIKNKRLCDVGVKDRDTIYMNDIFGSSLYILPATNKCRLSFRAIVRNPMFERFILVLILISSLMLAAESPFWEPGGLVDQIFFYTDVGMTILFTIEMILKIVTFGFFSTRGAYLKTGWNILDFCIVIVSVISLIARDQQQLKSLRSLRTLRALRPLRMISRRPQLKLVVNSLFAAIPNVLNVLIVCILFLLIFAIFCTNYFKGQFMACDIALSPEPVANGNMFCTTNSNSTTTELCNDYATATMCIDATNDFNDWINIENIQRHYITYPVPWTKVPDIHQRCIFGNQSYTSLSGVINGVNVPLTSRIICEHLEYQWERVVHQNFDNVAYSIGALFELSTTEGWVDVMYAAVDARGIDMEPVLNPNGNLWAAFWVFYIIVGSFFTMNLFVGVVIEAFNNQKAEKEGDQIEKSLFADEDQKKWMKTQALLLKLDPKKILKPPPEDSWRYKFFNLVVHPYFEAFIMACIIANTISMSIKYFGQPYEMTLGIEIINYIFSAIFIVEMILKLLGMGGAYFKSAWNLFDFSIVWLTIFGYIITAVFNVSIGPVAGAVRAFRIGRLIRLVRGAPKLRELINTLVLTLPALGNISAVLFLLYFIYAVMGVQLFAKVKLGDALNSQANFQSFGNAMMMLFRSATGENWNGVMYDLGNQRDCSVGDIKYNASICGFSNSLDCQPLDGCGNPVAFVYYISFTLSVTFVFFNLFIAVILEASEISTEAAEESLSEEHLTQFMKQWVRYDINDHRSITVDNLRKLLQDLDTPLGFGKRVASEKEITDLVAILHIPVYVNNQRQPIVLFMDTAHALAGFVHNKMAQKNGKDLQDMQGLTRGSVMSRKISNKLSQNLMLAGLDESASVLFTTAEIEAAKSIQRLYKAHKLRKDMDRRVDETQRTK